MGFITTEKGQGGVNIGYYHLGNLSVDFRENVAFLQANGYLSKEAYEAGEGSLTTRQMQIPLASLGTIDFTSPDAVRKACYEALNKIAEDVKTSKELVAAIEANPDATEQEKTDAAANKAALPRSHEEFSFFAAAEKDV